MSRYFTTTVYEPTIGAEAQFISVPADVVRDGSPRGALLLSDPVLLAEALGVRLGVSVPEPDGAADVFFASLGGRVVPFDSESFSRWRRQMNPDDPRSRFALDLTDTELVAVEESPLNGATLTSLATRGSSYVVGGWDLAAGHPLQGLGVLVVGQFGFVIAQVVRGIGDEAYLFTRYHVRRLLRMPSDWQP